VTAKNDQKVDFSVHFDTLKITNNHAKRRQGIDPMITQQPYPKGAKASPNGK
jgi:hypothetical protein